MRRLLVVVAAGVVLVGVAGCDDGAAASPPVPSVPVSAPADVGAAVDDAEQLLDDIDAELAADDASD